MKHLIPITNIVYASDDAPGTIADIADLGTLADGAIAMFRDDGSMYALTDTLNEWDKFYFVLGRGATGLYKSPMIHRKRLQYIAQNHTPAVAKVMYIGSDNDDNIAPIPFPTLVTGMTASIVVVDKNKSTYDGSRETRYSIVVASTDSDQDVVDNLVAHINADPNRIVLAAAVNTDDGISLTGTTAGYDFTAYVPQDNISGVSMNCLLGSDIVEFHKLNGAYDASIKDSAVAVNKGVGLQAQMIELENDCRAEDGYTDRLNVYRSYNIDSLITSATWDTMTLTFQPQDFFKAGRRSNDDTIEITLAIPYSERGNTDFWSVFATWFGEVEYPGEGEQL